MQIRGPGSKSQLCFAHPRHLVTERCLWLCYDLSLEVSWADSLLPTTSVVQRSAATSGEKAKPQRKEMKQVQWGPSTNINHLPNGRGIKESSRPIGNDEGWWLEILPVTMSQEWRKFPLNSRENCPKGQVEGKHKISVKGGTTGQSTPALVILTNIAKLPHSEPERCLLSQSSTSTRSLHLMAIASQRGQQCCFLSINSHVREDPKVAIFKILPFSKS